MPPKSEHVRARQVEDAVLPMATTALETGQLETARRLYRRLLDVDPESVPARMGLGDVALQERDTAAAARWYLSAVTRAGVSEARHAALLAHGRAALAAGQLEAARESFTRLAEPGENASRAGVAWGHNGVGLTLLLEGDLHGAVAAMEQAVLRAPEEERFQANLNRALSMLGRYPPPGDSSGDPEDVDVDVVAAGRRDAVRPERLSTLPPKTAVVEPLMPEVAESEDLPSAVPTPDSREETGAAQLEPPDDPPGPRIEGAQRPDRSPDESPAVELSASDEPAPVAPSAAAIEIPDREQNPALEPERSAHLEPDDTGPPLSAPVTDVGRAEGVGAASTDRPPAPDAGQSGQAAMEETEASGTPAPDAGQSGQTAMEGIEASGPPAPDAGQSGQTAMEGIEASGLPAPDAGQSGQTAMEGIEASGPPAPDAGQSGQTAMEGIEASSPPAPDLGGSPATGSPSPPLRVFVVTENNLSFLQFGAYAKPANAEAAAAHLRGLTGQAVSISDSGDRAGVSLHRVRMGPVPSGDALLELIAGLEAQGYRIANPPRTSAHGELRTGKAHGSLQTMLVHEAGERFLQAGAYSERSAAETLAGELRGLTERPVRISEVARSNGPPLHRVRIGPLESDDPLMELIGPAE